ncbi:MAG: hypothetical protein EA366_01205 [Spirulina sp. DLM2.Bin59]|nr:MAG: hypothetical protein EA366_01205 [Spirulina sp. DLM2.Bin59]
MAYPSGPYQSHLFNTINRQRIRWGDRLGRGLRSAQVAAVWGVQILLYPVYLLTQLGRDLALRLEAAVTQNEPPSLDPPDCDGPLRRILATIDDFIEHLPVAVTPHGLPSAITAAREPHPTVRGIACDCGSQSLVLTTEDNDSLAVLSPSQQHSLATHIRLELADYAYQNYRRKIQSYQYLIPARLGEDPQIWPLWRRFWQLMRWVQQSPVAIATNLFGESRFVPPPLLPPVVPVNLPPLPLPATLCQQLDQSAIRLETQQEQFQEQWSAWLERVSDRPAFPGTAQSLVQKAIAYFFGIEGPKALPEAEPRLDKQPWLHWEELPALASGLIKAVPKRRSLIDLDADMAIELYALNPPPPVVTPMRPVDPPPSLRRASSQTPDHQPDWLDVEAQPTGYERHWLEILLNGFDRFMAMLERGAIALWRWLTAGWQ